MAAFFTRSKQLQWLALLAIAVVLPTVSLLWFMSQVIANERLVVRQKLSALYQDKLTDAAARTAALFTNRLAVLDRLKLDANPYALFRPLVLENNIQGLVLWNADGSLKYPQTGAVLANDGFAESPLAGARNEEFARQDYAEAIRGYDQFTTDPDPLVAIAAGAGKSRCLAKLGRLDEAIAEGRKAAFANADENDDPALRRTVVNARLLLLSLLQRSGPTPHPEILQQTVTALIGSLYDPAGDHARLPANQNLFIARKVLAALQGPVSFNNPKAEAQFETLVAAEAVSIEAAETLRPGASQFDVIFQTSFGEQVRYGLRHRVGLATVLVLRSDAGLAPVLAGYHDAFNGTAAAYRIVDAAGNFVAGTAQPPVKPFTVAALPAGFPGWKVELYFEGGDVFEKAASRQIAVYTWTGFLVILLIVIAAGFATRAVGRQIRLNEMKNDFIATVSHELKTPLASMRVLVDTLLEGNVRDEAQVQHYLQLTAKENERLSRMIDNFLTFSRMERNKVAFTFSTANPAVMASDAIESVKTKYAAHHCHLDLDIAPDLPDLQADHDAMVTVLVNLLDNACKYTGETKCVALRIFPDKDSVCFAVSDNGIGLARRHLRKIFDRFYQVDNSLSRKAEGCGLGLSIVKFIVDAHKGTITVESKPGGGSTFLVRLPIDLKPNGD